MDDAKEEVRARLGIEDVVGEYVQLKRAGRNFKGLSPFTSEKTPSFIVSPEKQIWHDFSSNKGGDVFSFVMEVEGVDFRQALEQLARKAGVDLTMYQSRVSGTAKRKKVLLEATRLAAAYYQHSLLRNQSALEYVFKKRGFTKQTVTDFRIGYAPEQGSALVNFLLKKGYTKKDLADAGLTNRFGSDLFRGRMMIPLLDETGQAIGFTGRILSDDPNAPKYLNTPATLLYDKSRHIFGFSQAKEAIRKNDYSVLVEGNLDVVSSHQAGVQAVVATAGTALTEYQLKALRRLSGQVKLAFDGDKAGVAATERAIPIASSLDISLTVVTLPGDAKDPDELIQQDVKLWTGAIEAAEPAVDWVIKHYASRNNLTTGEGKSKFSTEAVTMIKSLHDPVEQDHYLQLVASMTDASVEAVRAKLDTPGKPETAKALKPVKQSTESSQPSYAHIDTILGAALLYPEMRALFDGAEPDLFNDPRQKGVMNYVSKNDKPIGDKLPAKLQDIEEYVRVVTFRAEKRYEGWRIDDIRLEIAELLRQYRIEYQKQEIENQIKSAEERGDEVAVEHLRRQHYALIKEAKRV